MVVTIEEFNTIESKYFDVEINGLRVWPLIREDLYFELVAKSTKTSRPNTADKDLPLFKKVLLFLSILLNTLSFFFKPKREINYLILNHPRKKNINGKYVDIYTDPILDNIGGSYIVLEGLFQLKHLKPSHQKNLIFADIFDFWPRLKSLISPPTLQKNEEKIWLDLEKIIYDKFDVKLNIIKRIKQEYSRFHSVKNGLKSLLKKLNPDVIIEVVVDLNSPHCTIIIFIKTTKLLFSLALL